MITTQGWFLAAAGFAMVLIGRLLGILEVFVLGVGLLVVVVAGLVTVSRSRVRIQASRVLRPLRVHVGGPGRVDLRIANVGGRRSPVLELRDPVGENQVASVLVGPLPAGKTADAQYAIDTSRRGVVRVGPLTAIVSDPFGVARTASQMVARAQLTVLPAVQSVLPLPHTSGDDPHDGAAHPSTVISRGDDFYALRAYSVGDDLRRVDWRATARRDELIVRQDQPPWQARSTIFLETTHRSFSSDSFEAAVSAAASVATACAAAGHLVRLVTSGGYDSGAVAAHAHLDDVLEELALVGTDGGNLADGLRLLHLPGSGGALAMLLGRNAERTQPNRAVRGYQRVITLSFEGDGARPGGDFPQRWRRALSVGRTGKAAR